MAIHLGFEMKYILNTWDILSHLLKVLLKVFSILLKVLSAYCVLISFLNYMLISTLIFFWKKIDYLQLYEPTREFLVELQKSTLATLMATSFLHFLSCLSEMLSFFICIFLLRHWLQFDLFRDSLWGNFGYGIFNDT